MAFFENLTTENQRFQMETIVQRISNRNNTLPINGNNPDLIDLSRIINSPALKRFCITLSLECISDALDEIRDEVAQADPKVQNLLSDFSALTHGWAPIGMYDKLTGLLNRSTLDHYFTLINELAQEQEISIALIAVDANNLGAVNNSLSDGHFGGDRYLCTIAKALSDWTHSNQLAFRLGGDEMLAISFSSSHPDPFSILERIETSCNGPLQDRSLFSEEERALVAAACGSKAIFTVSAGMVIYEQGMARGYALESHENSAAVSAYDPSFFKTLWEIADGMSYVRKHALK